MIPFIFKSLRCNSAATRLIIVRHKRNQRGIAPHLGRSLEQRLAELNYKDPEIAFKVDIGLPPPARISKTELAAQRKYVAERRSNLSIEKAAKSLTLNVSLEDIKEEWNKTLGPKQIQAVAEHYNIFEDLFGDAYFTPYVILNINYPQKNELQAPVCRGNVVKPAEAKLQPSVNYKSESDELWTLVLSNPDGHFSDPDKEYVHWLVGNIPGDNISKGETIFDYLPPFPPRGIGFQRLIFILYKQERKLDYSKLKKKLPCLNLADRTFKTYDFYRERQDDMTPAGLAFFQSDWDLSVRDTFFNLLNMEEPIYEYDYDPPVLNKQKWFPIRQPFNIYLDRFRDPRDLAKEHLLEKLKELNPFERPKKPFPYPDPRIFGKHKGLPSWLAVEKQRRAHRKGWINLLNRDEYE